MSKQKADFNANGCIIIETDAAVTAIKDTHNTSMNFVHLLFVHSLDTLHKQYILHSLLQVWYLIRKVQLPRHGQFCAVNAAATPISGRNWRVLRNSRLSVITMTFYPPA